MRRTLYLAIVAALGCTAPTETTAQTTRVVVQSSGGETGSGTQWISGAPVRTQVQVGADGQTYVGVWIDAPDSAPNVQVRPPMALSLVVDTSGSMSGAKIQNARMAAASLLETVADGDIVSLYAFSNGVVEIAPPTPVNQATRASLMQRVQYLHAGGGTNMYAGVTTGIQRIAQTTPSTHTVRRLVLISDGHANIGPADPMSLGNLAANGTEYGVQISAIGVGLDYDENTLGTLAVRSSGRLYHLEHPYQMAQILEREVNLLASTVATDAYIEIIPAPGVRILEGVTQGATLQNNRLRVPIGSVFAGQRRDVLFRAAVDTSSAGQRSLATARFVYRPAGSNQGEQVQTTDVAYRVTRGAPPANAVQPTVQAMVATVEAARAQRQAAEALNRGDRAAAERHFEFADAQIEGALAAPVRAEERERLQRTRTSNQRVRRRAAEAATPAAARGAALDSFDAAMEAEGY
ncbi:MAG: VWA domain-containing protein [Myxococcota bacterium]